MKDYTKLPEPCCGNCSNFLAYCNLCRLRGTHHNKQDKGKDACLFGFTPGSPVEFEDVESNEVEENEID